MKSILAPSAAAALLTLLSSGGRHTATTTSIVSPPAAGAEAGLYYAGQTLLQLLPPEIYSRKVLKGFNWQIPGVKITDQPRFGGRGGLARTG